MKTLSLILLCGALMTGCKVRQVDLEKKKVTTNSEASSKNRSEASSLDTSKVNAKVKVSTLDTSKVKTVIDSSLEAVTSNETIVYSNGKPVVIGPGQTFTGPADSTKIRSSVKSKKVTHQESTEEKGVNRDSTAEIRSDYFKTVDSLVSDSTHSKQSKTELDKNKHTKATPSYTWLWYVAGLLMLVVAAFVLYKKLPLGRFLK